MAEFTNELPRWDNAGTPPPESKKDTGWAIGSIKSTIPL